VNASPPDECESPILLDLSSRTNVWIIFLQVAEDERPPTRFL